MNINNGGPAYQNLATITSQASLDKAGNTVLKHEQFTTRGMSLRDYFAAAALQTIVFDGDYRSFALTAYMIADAMLAERERRPT